MKVLNSSWRNFKDSGIGMHSQSSNSNNNFLIDCLFCHDGCIYMVDSIAECRISNLDELVDRRMDGDCHSFFFCPDYLSRPAIHRWMRVRRCISSSKINEVIIRAYSDCNNGFSTHRHDRWRLSPDGRWPASGLICLRADGTLFEWQDMSIRLMLCNLLGTTHSCVRSSYLDLVNETGSIIFEPLGPSERRKLAMHNSGVKFAELISRAVVSERISRSSDERLDVFVHINTDDVLRYNEHHRIE
jgi:hypothetical protein